MTKVLAAVSDLHAVSTVGLCPPHRIDLDDGGYYMPSKAQRWLWQCWTEYWDAVEEVVKETDAELTVVLNGDLMDGDHHDTSQIISRNPTTMMDVTRECLDEPLDLRPDNIFVVRGTPSHVGKSASSEEGVAKMLTNDGHNVHGDPNTGAASWWHLRLDLGPVRISAAHHGRSGTRSYTQGSYNRLYAFDIWAQRALNGERHPDIAIRSHKHKMADSGTEYPTRLLACGAFQLATAYAHKVATESLADVGGWIVVVEDDDFRVIRKQWRPSRGHVWSA